jgi:NAD(P)-dependent dehydrogenase (short-subunit alcohol dehydrogenase family)
LPERDLGYSVRDKYDNDEEVIVGNLCESRVVAISGAGRGIGRAHALALAENGAKVVVNDLGSEDSDPAAEVVAEIVARGGEAVVSHDDVSSEAGAKAFIDRAVSAFGSIDVVINNAGIIRDGMIFNLTPAAWDAVIAVHLRSTFLTTNLVTALWREQSKSGIAVDGRIINTTSVAGLYGNLGQANYVAAKAGIAGFTIAVAKEVARYGVAVNAISPGAATRMTESLMDEASVAAMSPEHVARLAVWLCSAEAKGVTGRVIHASGSEVSIPDGWRAGRRFDVPEGAAPVDLGPVLRELLGEAQPLVELDGVTPASVSL